MKVLVLNGSPAGKDSITLFTVRYIEQFFPDCTFDVLQKRDRLFQHLRDADQHVEALL